ncbi:MAG: helicase-related protein [Thermodesulfobacteriota bacterium]
MNHYAGSLVRFRDRDWVVLAEEADVMVLRPITGDQRNLCSVYLPVERENLQPAIYPYPTPDDVGDFQSARLLRDAARLLLRNGTTPLRSLGHISFRPRPYQLVPLMMAMKLNPVRLLIADDVGIGKTIEAGLIARELLDRGEIRSIMVLCPPRLCDQWHTDLTQKFHIPTEVVRSNTLANLERNLSKPDQGIFEHYACLVASIDLIKTDRVHQHFLRHCPDFVIVDEAHGCAESSYRAEQQRHQLLLDVAANQDRHLLLVTATPHSGIDKSFDSLLGLLGVTPKNPEGQIGSRFVQRRRSDVTRWLETETSFPEREHVEITYELSGQYLEFFQLALRFCRKQAVVEAQSDRSLPRRPFGLALEMLRCVMSSPAAARTSLKSRTESRGAAVAPEEQQISEDTDTKEGTDDVKLDLTPCAIDGRSFDKQALKDLAALAASAGQLKDESDTKIRAAMNTVAGLLRERYNPIVFCHFVETATYVAKRLQEALATSSPEAVVGLVTGATPDTERHETLKQLFASDRRILITTDCLSEGVNLQEGFDSVVHYDLPWNPNRLEQREGRVDRFGQATPRVKSLLLFGTNNLIEAKVLMVLLRKSRLIRERLGFGMRLPIEDRFLERYIIGSDAVRDQDSDLDHILSEWDSIAEPTRRVQLGYAQGPFESEEVGRQLGIADSALGDPGVVERFFRTASACAGGFLSRSGPHWKLHANLLPGELRGRFPEGMGV